MRAIIALLALLPAMANATEIDITANIPTPAPGTDMTLTLTLTDVIDQRCPSTVDCYWEGMIHVEIAVTKGADVPRTIMLCNLCDDAVRDAVVHGTRVELRRLAPGRDVLDPMGRTPMLSDYIVTIDVTPTP